MALNALRARARKPGWRIIGALIALAGGYALVTIAMPAGVRRLAFFRVRRVEVIGARSIDPTTIVRAMALSAQASIVDPVAPAQRRVAAMPGIAKVEIARRLPGALVVTVVERDAVALAVTPRGLSLIDAGGTVLPFDPTRAAPDLPILKAPNAAAAGVLARIRDLEPDLYAQISAAWADGDDVVLETPHGTVRTDPTLSGEAMHAVIWVARDLDRKKRGWTELDARFAGQIVVRGGRA